MSVRNIEYSRDAQLARLIGNGKTVETRNLRVSEIHDIEIYDTTDYRPPKKKVT